MSDEDQGLWFVEWTYSPADYFEETLQIRHQHCELTIQDGKVEAKVDPGHGDPRPELCDLLHTELNRRFIGVQLVSHEPYRLSRPSVCCQQPDGKKVTFHETDVPTIRFSVSSGDYIHRDKDGNILRDSRAERIKKKRFLADLAAKCANDPAAAKILHSYNNAINDAANCLVHLYEIGDALAERFGSAAKAKRELKTKAQWEELGRLANDAPLKEGRHRGKVLSGLRDATKDEIDAAMKAAQAMIENYLKYVAGIP